MPELREHEKAVVIWRLRRDLETMKELCLKTASGVLRRSDLQKALMELHSYYDELRRRLRP